MDEFSVPYHIYIRNARTLQEYDRLETAVRYLTGMGFQRILELLAAGWELTPPKETTDSMLAEFGEVKL